VLYLVLADTRGRPNGRPLHLRKGREHLSLLAAIRPRLDAASGCAAAPILYVQAPAIVYFFGNLFYRPVNSLKPAAYVWNFNHCKDERRHPKDVHLVSQRDET